nr:universal stress protein [Streptomyces sp. NRRL S-146]
MGALRAELLLGSVGLAVAGQADGPPAHETADHPRFTDESARARRKRAVEALETALRAPADELPDVEVRRRIVEGQARTVLPDTSAGAALLVVGARHPHGRFGLHIGRVTHAVLHHAPCPVAVVPEEEAP